jgi:hypothetical protein
MRRGAWVGGLLLLLGCAETGDYTPQIHVTPGAAARVLWIESRRPHPSPGPAAAASTPAPGATATDDDASDEGDDEADAGSPAAR